MKQSKISKVLVVDIGGAKKQIKTEIVKEANNKLGKTAKTLGSELSITQINEVDNNLNKIQKQLTSEITIIQTKSEVDKSIKLQKPSTEHFVSKFANSSKTHEEPGDKPFQCPDCLKKFSGRSGLYTHMKSHRGIKPFSCNMCGKNFSSSAYLTCHMKVHTGEKPFECDVCHRTFINNGSLSTHKIIHAEVKPFKCEICNRDFPQEGTLRWHKKRVHPDNQQPSLQLNDKAPKAKRKPITTENKKLNYSEATEHTAWMLQFAD